MFIDLLRSRRSVRKFQQRPVAPEKVDLLMEAALRSLSSRGFNPWSFVVVDERERLERLSRAKPHGAAFLANAPLAVAVCIDPQISDVWVEDAAIATTILHLAATDLGLGSCWIQLRLRDHDDTQSAGDYAAGVLELPDNLTVPAIMAIGYADRQPAAHPRESLQFEKVSRNRFGSRS